MKRVIPLMLALLILLTSTCLAAYQPDPARWTWLGSTDEIGCFIDKETVQFSDDGNMVDFWICYVVPQKNEHAVVNHTINKIEKIFSTAHITIYDSKNQKPTFSYTYESWEQDSQKIVPGTNGEAFYRYFFPN